MHGSLNSYFLRLFDLQFDTQVFITWAMATADRASETGNLGPQHTVRGRTQMKYNLIAEALAVKPLGKKEMVNSSF